jgi:hypothetical protein
MSELRDLISAFKDVFDAGMVVLSMFTLNAFHPGILLELADCESAVDYIY